MTSLNTADARTRIEEVRRRAHSLAALADSNRVMEVTTPELAQLTGLGLGQIGFTRHVLEYVGALEVEAPPRGSHRATRWHFLKTGSELDKALDLEMERQMRGGLAPESQLKKMQTARRNPPNRRSAERVAVTEDRLGFAVAAVAGPDRPEALRTSLVGSGPNAPAALVMAAKQYHAGPDESVRKAAKLVEELSQMGIPVPQELAEKARQKHDSRLEAITLILPYIEELERQLLQAKDQIRTQNDYGTLRQTVERQRHQIERLVAERTAEALGQRPHQS